MQLQTHCKTTLSGNKAGIFRADIPQYPHSIQSYRFSSPLQVQDSHEFGSVRNKLNPPIASRFG